MTTVKEAKARGPERHLTNKYNYAGPGTFFKARQKGSDFYEKLMKDSGRKVVGTKPYNKPINKLDTCAVAHDRVYSNPKSTAAQVQNADRVFQKCISKVKVSDGVEQKLLAVAGKAGFDAKLAAEATGAVRKGSLSDGGAHRSTLGKKLSQAAGLGQKAQHRTLKGLKFR
jgi:hypothetical protein